MADGWAVVEVSDGELRLWPLWNGAGDAPITAPVTDDPGAVLQSMLAPLLPPGTAISVLATGWPGTTPVRVPCPPPAPLPGVTISPGITLHRLPGLVQDRPADLMATATTRIAGHLARHADFDGVLCLPGRATVWAHLSAGEIVSFRSFLTAEVLAALSPGPGEGKAGFTAAVQQAIARPAGVAAELSSVRALLAVGRLDASAAHVQMAGLLIGAELAAARPWWLGQAVTVIGEGWLAHLYATALEAQGVTAPMADPTRALLDGFGAARKQS